MASTRITLTQLSILLHLQPNSNSQVLTTFRVELQLHHKPELLDGLSLPTQTRPLRLKAHVSVCVSQQLQSVLKT